MLRVSTPVKAHLQVQHPSYKDFHFSSLPMCGFLSLNSTNYKHEKECFNVHFRLVQKSIAEIFLTSFHLNISGYYLLVRALCNHSIKIISLKMAAFTKNLHFEVLLEYDYNGKSISIPAHQKAHKRDQNNCTQPR